MPDESHTSSTGKPDPVRRAPSSRYLSRVATLNLAEEASLSTRGQRLPNIIQNRSYGSLVELRGDGHRTRRRSSVNMLQSNDDESDLELSRATTAPGVHGARSRRPGQDGLVPPPPSDFPLVRGQTNYMQERDDRRLSLVPVLTTPQMRSQRLIGNSNPRYKWAQYYKTEDELKKMRKPLRQYYERNNYLIQQYNYIDRLLDSSLPHNLIQEYQQRRVNIPATIGEETGTDGSVTPNDGPVTPSENGLNGGASPNTPKVKRTPKEIYRLPEEEQPLLQPEDSSVVYADGALPDFVPEEEEDSGAPIVTVAIYINFAANIILLVMKIIVTVLTSSLSVVASLVDGALDFLSTVIVWTTTYLINQGSQDAQKYPVGRRRLEPIGVLVFSVIMITSFFQVALEAIQRLASDDHQIIRLTPAAIGIMAATVVVKLLCWFWCRLIKNSSVQALAQDAMTDVIFNIFSIIFPLVGYYASIWWLDPLGGLVLSLYVIISWSLTTRKHIANLTGRACGMDERNILLYLTMRFASTIKKIQGLAAYHAGDKLNVEVDIVLDSDMSLRDSHDLSESLQYVLESVPGVERAFVHADYDSDNLPSHMNK